MQNAKPAFFYMNLWLCSPCISSHECVCNKCSRVTLGNLSYNWYLDNQGCTSNYSHHLFQIQKSDLKIMKVLQTRNAGYTYTTKCQEL